MAFHISNPEVDKNVRELAALTGETISEAVNSAVKDKLKRLRPRVAPPDYVERVLESGRRVHAALNPDDKRTADELVGYDEYGLPD